MKVQAIAIGYYANKRIKVGEIFELAPPMDEKGQPLKVLKFVGYDDKGAPKYEQVVPSDEDLFSERWMKKVEDDQDAAVASARTRPARVQQAPDARDVHKIINDQLGADQISYSGGSRAATHRQAAPPTGVAASESGGDDDSGPSKKSKK